MVGTLCAIATPVDPAATGAGALAEASAGSGAQVTCDSVVSTHPLFTAESEIIIACWPSRACGLAFGAGRITEAAPFALEAGGHAAGLGCHWLWSA